MSDGTHIEWADATWNPVTGCAVVSPGCTNCYAMRLAGTRLRGHPSRQGLTTDSKAGPVWNGEVRFNEQWLDQPLRWRRRPRRIFVCAHGDLFYERVPDKWIDLVFAVMSLCPEHTFLVLTKRAKRMRQYLTGLLEESNDDPRQPHQRILVAAEDARFHGTLPRYNRLRDLCEMEEPCLPLPNVHLGVSVENQPTADEHIPELLLTPAAVRWISYEPALSAVFLYDEWINSHHNENADYLGRLEWIVVGGESGPGARPMHPDWARSIRDQCVAAGVPFFFKQWGEWTPDLPRAASPGYPMMVRAGDMMVAPNGREQVLKAPTLSCSFEREATPLRRVGKRTAGRVLDGREWSEFPA